MTATLWHNVVDCTRGGCEQCLDYNAPCLPCWYCGGKDPEGDSFEPRVHKGNWGCEACDERREARRWIDVLRDLLTETVDGLTRSGWYDNKGQWQNGDSALVGRAKAVLENTYQKTQLSHTNVEEK